MSLIYLTRLVIETTSPMAITSGDKGNGYDTQLACDANGLPYIPASSIAGVWRSIVRKYYPQHEDFWFGTGSGQLNSAQGDARKSMLSIADGVVHDSSNKPVFGLKSAQDLDSDPLLKWLLQPSPQLRERVRINDRGVAADEAKFDQSVLPVGVRFCIDIQWHDSQLTPTDDVHVACWPELLACWHERLFVLGSTTRNGLGQFKLIASKQQVVDLAQGPEVATVLRDFALRKHIPVQLDIPPNEPRTPFACLSLKALDVWRSGRGNTPIDTGSDMQHDGQKLRVSYSQKKVCWNQQHQATLAKEAQVVLCGSSIKGILAHRVDYHLRRLNQDWAQETTQWDKRSDEVNDLFGHVDKDKPQNSAAGRLYVDDCIIEQPIPITRTYNSIDRFTAGGIDGVLYSEQLLYQPSFTLTLWLAENTSLSANLTQALLETLDDLKCGLLPLGAGSGRGSSLVAADDSGQWQVDNTQLTFKEAAK